MPATRRTLFKYTALMTAFLAAPALAAGRDEKAIVIYFSRTGSVDTLAREIVRLTGAQALRLELREPYAEAYSDMTDIARNERRTGARREISTPIPDLSGFETVYIGSPYWWGGLSIPMRTFLTDHPMEGKRVVPFCVSASSSPSGLWADVRRVCPKADIAEGFHTTESRVSGASGALQAWLKKLGRI